MTLFVYARTHMHVNVLNNYVLQENKVCESSSEKYYRILG